MHKLAEACERIAGTTKKLEKKAIVADYLKATPPEEASVAAVFLSGKPFPAWEETTLQVGGRLLWQVVEELSGKSPQELTAAYRKHGDLGAAAAEVLSKGRMGTAAPARPDRARLGSAGGNNGENLPDESELSLQELQDAFRSIAATRGSTAKALLVRELLTRLTPLEAKYITPAAVTMH